MSAPSPAPSRPGRTAPVWKYVVEFQNPVDGSAQTDALCSTCESIVAVQMRHGAASALPEFVNRRLFSIVDQDGQVCVRHVIERVDMVDAPI